MIKWIIQWYQNFTFTMCFLFKKYSLVNYSSVDVIRLVSFCETQIILIEIV